MPRAPRRGSFRESQVAKEHNRLRAESSRGIGIARFQPRRPMSVRSSTPATRLVAGVLCLLGAVLGPRTVSAVTIDFSLAGSGNLGVGTYTNGPVTADAFYESNGIFISTGVTLVVQNAADLHGFGVCSSQESGCASGGIQSELDNLGPSELVRLTLAPGWRWVDVSVSALTTVILSDRASSCSRTVRAARRSELHDTPGRVQRSQRYGADTGGQRRCGERALPLSDPGSPDHHKQR